MRQFSLTEAKAKLSELLDLVEAGEEVVISRHGKPIARFTRLTGAADELRRLEAIEKLRTFPRVKLEPGETIKGFIEEGRKY
jgi:prevent-host-death family protein